MYNCLQQIHVYECEAIYCQEAVASVALVGSCPTSEIEWDTAARRKNCSSVSSYQNCSTVEKFQYHCVINGYRNETLQGSLRTFKNNFRCVNYILFLHLFISIVQNMLIFPEHEIL